MKIGNREFKDESELSNFLIRLVDDGQSKMTEGKISSLCYEDMLNYWSDLVERAIESGELSEKMRDVIFNELKKHLSEPYPEGAVEKSLTEYATFGMRGLSS